MKIFIDTANIEQIKKANDMGLIDGVTTNPSLVAKENREMVDIITEISTIVDGPISAEVMSLDTKGMIEEARKLSKINKNIVIKIPMTLEGLNAVRTLSREGIKTNVTLIFSVHQGVLASKAGATYISPFVGRLDDIGLNGMDLIKNLIIAKKNYGFNTEIIAASIRTKEHILECILSGVDIATIPYSQIEAMAKHPLTDAGIEKFIKDYSKINK
ncbi:fructose-6-phosphate aldolase [Clostridium celatum]|uniref:Probable transaldolase n=1 Tax=Clostridium celatum DSM 1785 TaxID=545697 RepID=L1QMJ0_9CLOT|nr:fructose-6-phosphate aldolase [Clostridium celatum]EKY28920.1 fructose-6-phosphate aldolase [Clostridium celatum DSM 1785]MCE9655062.1 fructose-6-phosphate aldolase [Clostridium celatum]MDY3362253.1 fructose-6-phosphate aldolase [Clostridium celatum]